MLPSPINVRSFVMSLCRTVDVVCGAPSLRLRTGETCCQDLSLALVGTIALPSRKLKTIHGRVYLVGARFVLFLDADWPLFCCLRVSLYSQGAGTTPPTQRRHCTMEISVAFDTIRKYMKDLSLIRSGAATRTL